MPEILRLTSHHGRELCLQLPSSVTKIYHLRAGDYVQIFKRKGQIILTPMELVPRYQERKGREKEKGQEKNKK
jgi:hypothetical protein